MRIRRAIVCVGFPTVLLSAAAGAQQVAPRPESEPATRDSTAITAARPSPVITAVGISACIQPGASLTVRGRNFLPRGRRQAVLVADGLHIDLPVTDWQDALLTVTVPRDARAVPGGRYSIGIEAEPHSPWVSNLDRSVVVCGDEAAATAALDPPPAPDDRQPDVPDAEPSRPPGEPGDPVPGEQPAQTDQPEPREQPNQPVVPQNPFAVDPDQPVAPDPSLLGQADPDADGPQDAEPEEMLVWHADLAAAQAFALDLPAAGFTVQRRQLLDGLGVVQTTIGLPPGTSRDEARDRLVQIDPDLLVDANHRFRMLGTGEDEVLLDLVGWTNPAVSCLRTGTLGLIDTVVEGHHPAFADRDVVVRSMLPAGIEPAEVRHGTAIGTRLVSLAPGAGLRVAAVFRQRDDETTDTTAEWLVLAIDWLLREDVDVINLSLGGPDNRLLEAAVSLALDRNVGIVAAVGDGGPGSVPVHPSAWPGVIGVTAVDRDRNVYRQARQGSEVDIAAPGVDLPMLGAEGTETYLTGTSYAAPFVTAAWLLAGGAEPVFDLAQDLGDPGRDDVYGAGLLRFDRLCRR